MKTKDLRELSVEELARKEQGLAEEIFNLKFQHGIRPLENTAKLGQLRRDIARVKTVASQKVAVS